MNWAVFLTASPIEVFWTALAMFFAAGAFLNLIDAWVDNQTIIADTNDGLGDLAPTGRVIALDNIGREAFALFGLVCCIALGFWAMARPPTPPPPSSPHNVAPWLSAAFIIGIELSLIGISGLGQLRRLTARRLLDATLRSRAEAAAIRQTASVAAIATEAIKNPKTGAPPSHPDKNEQTEVAR